MTINVREDFVDHLHVYQSPAGGIFVQHERNDGDPTEADPRTAIQLLVKAAYALAAAHGISLDEEA
jgi:hypothetical protein